MISNGSENDMVMPVAPMYGGNGGCDSMGRYTSRDNDKEGMIEHLRELMMNARTEDERENYRQTIDKFSRN